jgi:sugar phosphate isomerase/epimerase
MKYFISTINFAPTMKEKISDVIPEMIDKGYKNIEISSFHPYEKIDLTKYNANILLHNFAPPDNSDLLINLCSENSDEVKHFIKERITLTRQLGQEYYSFHAGFRVDSLFPTNNDKRLSFRDAMNKFIVELKEIVDFAEEQKVHIGVENHFCIRETKDNLLLYNIMDWDELFSRIDSRYLHLHLDIGHLKIASNEHDFDAYEFLEKLGHKVMGVHVHDNTGWKIDCHAPIDNNFWFTEDHWRQLNNLEYVILETRTMKDMNLINYMIDYIEEEI